MTELDVIQQKAQQLWDSFDENERTGVRVGLFPIRVQKAEKDLGLTGTDPGLAVALMRCAKADGGMIA